MDFSIILVLTLVVLTGEVYSGRHCKCYEIFKYQRRTDSWREARSYCQKIGGDLVKIDDAEEDAYITSLLKTESRRRRQRGWWIGGRYLNGQWQWADGTPMEYENFPVFVSDEAMVVGSKRRLVNYAAIFYDRGAYNWGYVSPRDLSRMGFVCELDRC